MTSCVVLRRLAALLTLAAVLAPGGSLAQESSSDPDAGAFLIEGRGTVTGEVRRGGKPVAGAVVHAYHIDSGSLTSSAPTAANGKFRIEGVKHGYVDLAVEVDGDLYSGNQILNLAPSGKLALEMDLIAFAQRPAEYESQSEAIPLPGVSGEPTGLAELQQKLRGKDFWKSPKGIAILAGVGGGALLAIALGSGTEQITVVSPSSP